MLIAPVTVMLTTFWISLTPLIYRSLLLDQHTDLVTLCTSIVQGSTIFPT